MTGAPPPTAASPEASSPDQAAADQTRALAIEASDRRTRWIRLLSWSLVVAAVVSTAVVQVQVAHRVPSDLPVVVLLAAFLAAELVVVRIYLDAHSHTFSLSEAVLVVGMLYAAPTTIAYAQALAMVLLLGLYRRLPVMKLVFNVGNTVFATMVGVGLFHALCDGEVRNVRTWLAAVAGVSAYAVLSGAGVSGVIAVSRGEMNREATLRMMAYGEATALGNGILALIGATLASLSWALAAFVVVPLSVLVVAYRGYIHQRRRYETLDFLYHATIALHEAPNLDDGLISVLEHAREALRVQFAQAVLFTPSGALTSVAAIDERRRVKMGPLNELVTDACHEVLPHLDGATILDVRIAQHRLLMDVARTRGGVAVPLVTDGEVAGVLVVGERISEFSPFGAEEAKLVNLLANQVNVALERGALERSLSQLIELEAKLTHQAHHDPLTGLANRTLLRESVAQALTEPDAVHAVLIIDLDDFKTVNDSLGHAAGDQLLTVVALRIQGCVRAGDVTARLGGDEFALLLKDVSSASVAQGVAAKIIDELTKPVWIEGREMAVRASVGIALTEPEHGDVGEVLRNADMAMYRAKGMGKGRYALYEPGMHGEVTKRLAMSAALTRAVEHGELSLAFQPIVELVSGHVYGVEALARWTQPDGTAIAPVEFIPLAEETGLILPIGAWVLDAACEQLARWHRGAPGGRDLIVSVNVSARQLMEPTFMDDLRGVISRHGVRPGNLVLELTESVLIEDVPSVTRTLDALKECGVRLAIDDFGTGYSSMNYVSRFPIDVLKIDQSFVEAVSENTTSTALVAAMVQLANSLGITAVAEGVEREEQAEALRRLGCRLGQGFLFARPVPAAQVDDILERAWRSSASTPPREVLR